MSSAAISTEIVHSAEALNGLEAEWWELWARAKAATPFQAPGWLLAWWRAFAPGELFVVAVRAQGRLVALAPCYLQGPSGSRRVLPLGASVSDYLDVLIDADAPAAVAAVLVAQLAAGADWCCCEFLELKPEANAIALPCPAGCRDALTPVESCPVLVLPSALQGLHEVIPAGTRRDIRQAQHRMARRGAIGIAPAKAGELEAALDELVRLHRARFRDRGGGVLSDARLIAFHRAAMAELAAAGLLRCYLLELAGSIGGVYYGFSHAGSAYAYLGGFDPALAFASPGTLLLDHAIREAVREGAREFHFLRGREAYKYRWGASDRWNCHRILRRGHEPHSRA